VFVWIMIAASLARASEPANCGVFLLKRDRGQVMLERVPVPPGETVVVPAGPASGVIGLVFPPGPGVSGSVEQVREGRMIILRCLENRLRCEVRSGGEVRSGYPERDTADLARYDTRVSVVGGDGTRAVFLVRGYAVAAADVGPVQNLLAGASIPLGADDFVVTTDTYARATGAPVQGEVPVELRRHAFIRITGSEGRTGWFILDTGAAETVISKTFLADTARITPAAVLEYSAAGRRVLTYAPSGATGPVQDVLGHTRLAGLRAGTLRFDDVEAAVLPEIPDLFDRPVAGIIGLDLLRRGESVTLEYPPGAAGTGRMRLGPAPAAGDAGERVPFALVSSHPVIPVRVNGRGAFMILDTGAPGVVLDSATALAVGMTFVSDRIARGIDGGSALSASATIDSLDLGDRRLSRVPCQVSALHVFRTLAAEQPMGLLGNAPIARFERVVIDFSRQSVLFAGDRQSP
jgi:predicted aspartyl protease